MENIELILAENVKSLRKEQKLSQERLAENCGLSGFVIQSIEGRRQWPELATLNKVADALDIIRKILALDSKSLNILKGQLEVIERGSKKTEKKKEA